MYKNAAGGKARSLNRARFVLQKKLPRGKPAPEVCEPKSETQMKLEKKLKITADRIKKRQASNKKSKIAARNLPPKWRSTPNTPTGRKRTEDDLARFSVGRSVGTDRGRGRVIEVTRVGIVVKLGKTGKLMNINYPKTMRL
jgi:hypothetical protein